VDPLRLDVPSAFRKVCTSISGRFLQPRDFCSSWDGAPWEAGFLRIKYIRFLPLVPLYIE
jgi:hypothetical protein